MKSEGWIQLPPVELAQYMRAQYLEDESGVFEELKPQLKRARINRKITETTLEFVGKLLDFFSARTSVSQKDVLRDERTPTETLACLREDKQCGQMAFVDLFCASCRLFGVPCRRLHGMWLASEGPARFGAITEIYHDGARCWIPIDPRLPFSEQGGLLFVAADVEGVILDKDVNDLLVLRP